jgi:hypothetical protein
MFDFIKKVALASPPGRRLRARIDTLQARIAELEAAAVGASLSAPPVQIVYMIDALWRDIHGTYIRGWAHAFARQVIRIVASSDGSEAVVTELESRPDVLAHYPSYPHVVNCGFRLYIPTKPFAAAQSSNLAADQSALANITIGPRRWLRKDDTCLLMSTRLPKSIL